MNKNVLNIIFFQLKNKKKKLSNNIIVTRDSTVLPQFINFNFKVHNGLKYNLIKVTPNMVGDKFGMYSITRKKNLNRYKKWRKK